MSAYGGVGGRAPFIINLGTKLRAIVKFTPLTFYSWYSLNRRFCRSQSQSQHSVERIRFLPVLEFEPRISQPLS